MRGSRHTPDQRIIALATRRHDVFTREQALDVGFSRAAIDRRLASGRWERLHPGVYALAGTLMPHTRWLAAVLAGGEGAVLSHQSAAALWGIGPMLVLPVHVIAQRQKRRRPGFVPHRHRLDPSDITTRARIPVTTPARTIAHLPPGLRDDAAIKARVLRLLDDGGPMYRSRLEQQVHRIVLDLGLSPEINETAVDRERDLVWPEQKVVIEVDGPHHEHPAQQAVDAERDRELRDAGWRIGRVKG